MPLERLTPERRREQTRAHLLAAAAEVFAKRGYYSATLDEIAETAGFSKGAVYSNFSSKTDLFLALSRQREEELVAGFAAAAADESADGGSLQEVYAETEGRDEAWALSAEFTLFALRDPAAHEQLTASSRARHELLTELVQRQCEEDGVEPPLPPDVVARIYEALFTGLWQQQVLDPASVDDTVFPDAARFVRRALSALGTPTDPA